MRQLIKTISVFILFCSFWSCQEDIYVASEEFVDENTSESSLGQIISLNKVNNHNVKELILKFDDQLQEILIEVCSETTKIDKFNLNLEHIYFVEGDGENQYIVSVIEDFAQDESIYLQSFNLHILEEFDTGTLRSGLIKYHSIDGVKYYEIIEQDNSLGIVIGGSPNLLSNVQTANRHQYLSRPVVTTSYRYGPNSSVRPHTGRTPYRVALKWALSVGNGEVLAQLGYYNIGIIPPPYPDYIQEMIDRYTFEIPIETITPDYRYGVNDLTIPNQSGTQHTRLLHHYVLPWGFLSLYNPIQEYYKKAYVLELNGYYNTQHLNEEQHLSRQAFIDAFFYWLYDLQQASPETYSYLQNNSVAAEKIFNFFSIRNRTWQQSETVYPGSTHVDADFINYAAEYLLENPELIEYFGEGYVSESEFEGWLKCISGFGDCDDYVTFDDSFLNNEKADCVYDRLNAVCGNLFNQTIGQFQDDPTLHLEWRIDNINYNGQTSPLNESTNTITITLDSDYVNNNNTTTQLRLARTILHESIHANIKAFLEGKHDLANENQQNTLRLTQLYKYYKSLEDPDYSDNWPDHIFMIENYIEPIANAIWELNSFEGELENYYWFAWDGLKYWDENELYITDEEFEEYRILSLEIDQNPFQCD